MNIDKQMDLVRKQQPIDNAPVEECLKVFARSVYSFRKFISPMNQPAELEKNLKKIMLLCRLENNDVAYAMIVAARATAQLDSAVMPGEWDDLSKACGLDVLSTASTAFGEPAKRYVMVNPDTAPDNSFELNYRDQKIYVVGGAQEGSESTDKLEEALTIVDRLNTRKGGGGQRYIEIDYAAATEDDDIEIFDTVHDPWRPTSVYHKRLKIHPTAIIEPSTLAATPYPKPNYKPLLPAEAIDRGFISDAQFEVVVYALQAITEYLPGSPNGRNGINMKGGYIIGDGTGVGKTNEFCAVIMDQWLRGKKRHVIVVERTKHVQHIKEAWAMIGGNPKDIMFQGDRSPGESLPTRDGIMITTYALIRRQDRYDALLAWANEYGPCEGVLVFDEAQNMRNAIEDIHEEGAGKRNQSDQGMRGVEMQEDMPRAGVIYASATMATDVYNLGYATRLGLWGENAPFYSSQDFIGQMHLLDEAALEQICIDLKSAGRYSSRTLSFDGVEYEELTHNLTPRQKERFNQTVQGWREYSKIVAAARTCCTGIQTTAGQEFRQHIKAQRNTIETLLTNFKTETMIRDIHEELAQGHAPVIQISMTGEARTKRVVGDRHELEINEYQENTMEAYILSSFPIYKMVDVEGKKHIVTDKDDNPIVIPQAVALRDQALALSKSIVITMNALDQLYLEFGPAAIAEMTGRSIRMIPRYNKGAHNGWIAQERSPGDAISDVEAFQNGKKDVLIFSVGAGGTGLSYHAQKGGRNQKRRVHYLLEIGRRPDTAVQGLGRTHRAGQVMPPYVKSITSDIPADMIYNSKTLAKISRMGALSRGHQHANANAIFEQAIPLHSVYARQAWDKLIDDIKFDRCPGITYDQLKEDMALERIEDFDSAIMRLAVLTDKEQHGIMNELRHRTEEEIAIAVRSGTYNQGMETIRANSIEIVDESKIENGNGSHTTYYRLRRHQEIERTPFSRAAVIYAGAKRRSSVRAIFMRHKVNSRIVLAVTQENGYMVDVTSPSGNQSRSIDAMRREPWAMVMEMADAERYWNLESENMDVKEYSELHMLSGSLLYNWDKLPEFGVGLHRCKTDDNKVIVGRIIQKSMIKNTLQALGMRSGYSLTQIAQMLSKVKQGAVIDLEGGWSIDMPKGSVNYRLNVPDADQTGSIRNMLSNMGVLSVNTPLGYEFEINQNNAVDVLQQLAIGADLSLSGTTNNANTSNVALAAMLSF